MSVQNGPRMANTVASVKEKDAPLSVQGRVISPQVLDERPFSNSQGGHNGQGRAKGVAHGYKQGWAIAGGYGMSGPALGQPLSLEGGGAMRELMRYAPDHWCVFWPLVITHSDRS